MIPASVRLLGRALLEDDFQAMRALIRREMALGRGARTLELGCGPGLFADVFSQGDYVGVDADPRDIDRARRTRPGIFVVGDARRGLELPDARFDQLLIHGLIDRLPDAEARAVLGETIRVLAPGGMALVVEPVLPSRHDRSGRLIARFAGGRGRRSADAYRRLYRAAAPISREEVTRSGLLVVFVAVLNPPKGRAS